MPFIVTVEWKDEPTNDNKYPNSQQLYMQECGDDFSIPALARFIN